ncbi:MAG: trypsin-like peptidase domain-containing protein [Desulfobacterales bacterium]|nr:trypsin-like peptidase domain-containing protein [Desulfobacterales bacterium]
MKKNNNFNNFQINSFVWPIIFIIILIIGAIFTNADFIQDETAQSKVKRYIPSPKANIQTIPAMNVALSLQEDISRVISMVKPSVVTISSDAVQPQNNTGNGLNLLSPYDSNSGFVGSGVIIDKRGYVLTTFQTIGKANVVKVKLFSGGKREYQADVVGVDTNTDLAILKIKAQEIFPTVLIANSDLVEVGDIVFAVGSPYGFSRTVTMGIVSSNNRKLNINGIRYPDMIQTDASINKGNDGGPLVNVKGEVIGINIATYMPENHFSGIGFAVPINDVLKFVDANL